MQFPKNLGNISLVTDSKDSHRFEQPSLNPHRHLLNRSTDSCPTHLSTKQKESWLKAGEKASANQHLLSAKPHFQWSKNHYDGPFHNHHRIPISFLQSIFQKIAHVRPYTIDTESDKPTHFHRHSLPALLQIQAIHDDNLASALLIEVQHLPHPSTSLSSNPTTM